ncbi:MAG: PqqD family protein [Deltaproteobacteria bacterium]|nr:PqqD family protein [Deltaproteobacteria bacterium]
MKKKTRVRTREKPARKTAENRGLLARFAVHNPDVAWRIVDGEAAVVTPADGTLHLLNEVGTAIWLLAEKPVSLSSVVDRITAEFEVKRTTAGADVAAFVEDLAAKQLLIVAAAKKLLRAG